MNLASDPLEAVRWEHHEVAVYSGLDLPSFATFRREVVLAAVEALDTKIDALENSEEEVERVFAVDHYADIRQSTIEAFLLATQSMHERALRGLMVGMAGRKTWPAGRIQQIQRCSLDGKGPNLLRFFQELFDAPMEWFGVHADLQFLHLLGNALRHGNGDSAIKIHQLAPSLWITWLPPGSTIGGLYTVPLDAPRHPAFDTITLPRVLLDQMMMAVRAFWEDIEFVRCNSFSRKCEAVEKHMKELREQRARRSNERAWTPG
ncbi:TPA: hypothetical protein ACXIFB_000736 [Stenotrophomonas maltophilia]|nr:hypothetical protein [Stenotrophomonas maltophilia]